FDHEGTHWYRLRVGFYSTKSLAVKEQDAIEKALYITGTWLAKPTRMELERFSQTNERKQ
ncbi:MAG: hypothetical protein KAR06_01780, partial [Deltaproteobacteria bacterium]|nr:hypothetical protein [Deltaproteobacteria bacterium]